MDSLSLICAFASPRLAHRGNVIRDSITNVELPIHDVITARNRPTIQAHTGILTIRKFHLQRAEWATGRTRPDIGEADSTPCNVTGSSRSLHDAAGPAPADRVPSTRQGEEREGIPPGPACWLTTVVLASPPMTGEILPTAGTAKHTPPSSVRVKPMPPWPSFSRASCRNPGRSYTTPSRWLSRSRPHSIRACLRRGCRAAGPRKRA
jgi:hypothetical protein